MAKGTPEYTAAPIMFIRETDEFKDIQFAYPLNGPFELANPVQAIQMEATAKGLGVVVRVALVSLDDFWGVPPEESKDDGSRGQGADE